MVDYTRGTGATGTMLIRDTGYNIEFWLNAGQSATFVNNGTWSGVVNGVAVGGTFSYPSGNPWIHIATYGVSTSQTVRFSIGATGTQGLGGPTDFYQGIHRATVPPAPSGRPFDTITTTSVRYLFDGQGDGGSPILEWEAQIDDNSNFSSPVWSGWSSGTITFSGLNPATPYYARSRGRNAVGWGPYSNVTSGVTLPAAPALPTVSDILTQSIRVAWSRGSNGSALNGYDLQYSTSPTFASGVTTVPLGSGVTSHNVTGLTPGTTYYFRVRSKTAGANSDWSSTRQQATLPATAPGMTVTPGLSGLSAVVSLTPPGGASGVTEYHVERRIGTGAATTHETTTNSLTVNGLTPGQTYEWRASAFFGDDYQSPWTAWVPVIQPNPNTNPGEYFDGSTPTRDDITFSWTGTVNNSTSVATGVGCDGWDAYGVFGFNGFVQIMRTSGGRSGQYCARMQVMRDSTAYGGAMGMRGSVGSIDKTAEVEPSSVYVGSMYVRPSRSQRLRVEMQFLDETGLLVGLAQGAGVLVSDTAEWTRLVVSGTAPATAAHAAVLVYDFNDGAGWSPWLSGEWLDADDMMVTLSTLFDWFSGDTPDVPGFDYTWLGTPNASVSARLETEITSIDPLADPDCPPPPAPPALPTIPADCIEEVGIWRRYTLQIPATEVRVWSSTLPTLILNTQTDPERQVRIRYYPNPNAVAPELLDLDAWEAEQILTYIPPNTEITLDGVTQLVTASVAGAAPIDANRLLYGTGGVPASWPELRCGIGYVVTMDVPLDAPAGNLDASLVVTQRM